MKKLSQNEIKQIELDILIKFNSFCIKNNLTYYIAYGTMLGAVRHKGFIPWDNDIDVCMPRPDYNKLMELSGELNNLLDSNIELKTPYSKNYQYSFCKIINNKTFVHEHSMKDKYNTSVWIDIFPIEGLPANEKKMIRYINTMSTLRKYYSYTIEKKFSGKSIIGKIKFNTIKIILTPLYFLINQKIQFEKKSQKYSFQHSNLFSVLYDWYPLTCLFDKKLLEIDYFDFEGYKFPGFKNYDKYLTQLYGDYMKLPPIEEQLSHDIEAYLIED